MIYKSNFLALFSNLFCKEKSAGSFISKKILQIRVALILFYPLDVERKKLYSTSLHNRLRLVAISFEIEIKVKVTNVIYEIGNKGKPYS